ncbi:unnamed protein product [Pedinophyceae sp. YPF-701]|nr:unnamed protein product [Pedinophyceae sp. YPF-701]
MAAFGGDEINAVVVDVGSWNVKAGYAGEDVPKAVFPGAVGVLEGDGDVEMADENAAARSGGVTRHAKGGKTYLSGDNGAMFARPAMDVRTPFGPDGSIEDWDALEAIYRHIFADKLAVGAKDAPVMIAEPSDLPAASRQKLVEIMFETFQVPAVFLSKNHTLSMFATAKSSALVVDVGHQHAVCAAVHDGYVLQKTIVRNPVAGALLSELAHKVVTSATGNEVRPRYTFTRKQGASGDWTVEDADTTGITKSFHAYHTARVCGDIKEAVCKLSESKFTADELASHGSVKYELPDGQTIEIDGQRFAVPEVLFDPSLAKCVEGGEAELSRLLGPGRAAQGLAASVKECIDRCDVDIMRDMWGSVTVCGGTSLFTSMRDRLETQLTETAPVNMVTSKVRVHCPANDVERIYSTWIGGSILSSLGSFQQMWMSKQEYEEHGSGLIQRKAP